MGLERTKSDVLILLDSCASAGSAGGADYYPGLEGGTTELIAACGFGERAPGPGPHSFTNGLIAELRELSSSAQFSAVILHQRILTRLVHWSPNFNAKQDKNWLKERRTTPVYVSLCKNPRQKSIPLMSLHAIKAQLEGEISEVGPHVGSVSKSTSVTVEKLNSIMAGLLNDPSSPKVLLAISLQGDQWLECEKIFADWIRDIPLLAKAISLEGVFESFSTLLMVSLPIALWDLLPQHPAYSFVGFTKSSNMAFRPDPLYEKIRKWASAYGTNLVDKRPRIGFESKRMPPDSRFGDATSSVEPLERTRSPSPNADGDTISRDHGERDEYHIEDLGAFTEILQQSLKNVFPNNRQERYPGGTRVLLLCWQETKRGYFDELQRLSNVFSQIYRFNVEIFQIPLTQPYTSINWKLASFIGAFDDPTALFIIYYGGDSL